MRQKFFEDLERLMADNQDVFFITGDLGFGLADRIRDRFAERFINTGAAECAMMGVAIGLALEGKVPFVYSITPFLLFRPFEAIRNYVDHERIPVILVGSGRDRDYAHDGFSHYAHDDAIISTAFPNIRVYYEYITLEGIVKRKMPAYINLKR